MFNSKISKSLYLLPLLLWLLLAAPASAALLDFVQVVKDGQDSVDGLAGAWSVAVSPDGQHLYTASFTDNAVAVFSRNATSGVLTFVEMKQDGVGGVDGLGGARLVTVSPDGSHLYVASQGDRAVAVFSRNATTGALTFVEMQRDGVNGVDGLNGAFSVVVSPDGKHLYAASISDDAVAVFSRNATSGALTFVEIQKDGVNGVDGLNTARSVTVSPDGSHLYAAGSDDDAVAVFSRNATTGALTFVEMQKDGVNGVDGLNGAFSVVVSSDGKHLYAAGSDDNAVAVFSRNGTSGALTFVEMQKDGVNGVDGLSGAFSVAVSSDGKHLYAAGSSDNAVAVFSRNATSGALAFVEMKQDGVDSVDGLAFAISVAVSPDGKHLYTTGFTDNAVAVFLANQMAYLPLIFK